MLIVPDLCVCDQCRHTFPDSILAIEAPKTEEMEKLWP
jgi:hypothetical protein